MVKFLIAAVEAGTTPDEPEVGDVVQGVLIAADDAPEALATFASDYPVKAAVIDGDPSKEAQAFDFTALTPQQIAQAEEGLSDAALDLFRGPYPDWYLAKRGLL